MKQLLTVLWFAAVASVAFSSDDTLRRGIFGTYSRVLGMEAILVELRQDGAYVVTIQSCLVSEEEGRGRWLIKDGVVLLDRGGDRKRMRDRLTRFDIVVVDGDLTLKPQDDIFESEDKDSEDLLFRRQKKEANQTLEPTRVLGTSAAEPPRVPSTRVAHL